MILCDFGLCDIKEIRKVRGDLLELYNIPYVGSSSLSSGIAYNKYYTKKILDNFDRLNKSITEGLPAEIEARQKQYEYYRDKLLTFKELVNEG